MSVDIVVATYSGREELLKTALDSVLVQTYTDWVCWVCQDGDESGIKEIVDSYNDPRFRYLHVPKSGRPAPARNRALLHGQGQFVAFLDDDDEWLSNKLDKQIAFMAVHAGCSIVATEAKRWCRTGLEGGPEMFMGGLVEDWLIPFDELLQSNRICTSSVLIRRSSQRRAGYMFDSPGLIIGEDYEFWLRLALTGDLWAMKDVLVHYHDDPANSIRSHVYRQPDKRKQQSYAVYRALLDKGRMLLIASKRYDQVMKKFDSFF